MVEPRLPQSTVCFVDNYCRAYQPLFSDVRSFEAFTALHLGLLAPLPRKSLPAIAKAVGLPNDQVLHHFLTHSPWQVEAVRYQRLSLILEQIQRQPIVLVIDDTSDRKKGKTTDSWTDSTLAMWAKSTMAWSLLMPMEYWAISAFPCYSKCLNPDVA